jgi:hypothetical protein
MAERPQRFAVDEPGLSACEMRAIVRASSAVRQPAARGSALPASPAFSRATGSERCASVGPPAGIGSLTCGCVPVATRPAWYSIDPVHNRTTYRHAWSGRAEAAVATASSAALRLGRNTV